MRRSLLPLLSLLLCAPACSRGTSTAVPDAPVELRVAAAADLARAFRELGTSFERSTGERVVFTFGSTGLLAKQIAEGAPFDVFAAANVSFVDDLARRGAADRETKALYARGRIVVYARPGARAPEKLEDLARPEYARIAIANPEHAPYGKAAQQALERAGILAAVQSRFVFGENVQQTQQFAETGNAEVAIIAMSLAIGSKGSWLEVSDSLHDPIDQAIVVTSRAARAELARRFAQFVNTPDGRAVMRRYGFLLPGELLSRAP